MSTDKHRGQSLTPKSRAQEVATSSVNEGLLAALITAVPSAATVMFMLKKYPAFANRTNVSSRTALIIMPPFFAFAFTSETKVNQKMEEMAEEAHHAKDLQKWQDKNEQERQPKMFGYVRGKEDDHRASEIRDQELQMTNMYRNSIENSGVRIVPGASLSTHHVACNFIQEHPFKLLTVVGVPSVAYIFYGKNHQQHLQVQQQIMHTRVIGQFTVIALLLTFMGFKTYMDMYGKFITEAEMDLRVKDMQLAREHFMETIQKGDEREEHIKELKKHLQEEEAKEKMEKIDSMEANKLTQDKV